MSTAPEPGGAPSEKAQPRTRLPSRRATWALLLFAVLLYAPTLGNGYALDDTPIASSVGVMSNSGKADVTITADFDESAWDYFSKFFKRHYWYPESHNDGLFRPISVLSYGLVYQFVGQFCEREEWPQHLVNILVYAWCVWLVLALMANLGMSPFASLLTGLVFCVHAIHSEVVAGVIGRAEMFAFAFGAQAYLLLLKPAVWRVAVAALCMFCALGSKESAIAWIPFFFCLKLARSWQLEPDRRRFAALGDRLWADLVVLLVPLGAYLWLRAGALDDPDYPVMKVAADFSSNPLALSPTIERVATGTKVWGYALLLCLVPYQLSCLYSPHVFAINQSLFEPTVLLSLAALLGFLFCGLRYAFRCPLLFVAMACFLGFSFLTSNVPMPIGTILGERTYFTPSLGVCMLPALLWPWLRQSWRKPFLIGICVWAAGNCVMALSRSLLWKDSAVLFFHDSDQFPRSIDLHRKSAACLHQSSDEADVDKAVAHLEAALKLQPNYTHAHRLMGEILISRREYAKAIESYQQAYGQGYLEPEGAEGLAFAKIGDCYRFMARQAGSRKEREALFAKAMSWYERSLQTQDFSGHQGEAYVGRAGIFSMRAERAATDKEALDNEKRAIAELWRCVQNQPPTDAMHLKGLKQLATRMANKGKAIVSREQMAEVYQRLRRFGGNDDPDILVTMGGLAYVANLPAPQILQPLDYLYKKVLPQRSSWGQQVWQSRLFYAEALLEINPNAKPQARQICEELLSRPEIGMQMKQQIRNNLRNHPKWR